MLTDVQMDGQTDKGSYRVACPQLKTIFLFSLGCADNNDNDISDIGHNNNHNDNKDNNDRNGNNDNADNDEKNDKL